MSEEIWEEKIDVMKMFFSMLNHDIPYETAIAIFEDNGFGEEDILEGLLCEEDVSSKPEFTNIQIPINKYVFDYLDDIKSSNLPIVFESLNKDLEDIDKVKNLDDRLMVILLQDYCDFDCTGMWTTGGMICNFTQPYWQTDYSICIDDIENESIMALDLGRVDVNSKYLTQKAIENLLITYAKNRGCIMQNQYSGCDNEIVYFNPKLPSRVAEAIIEHYEKTHDADLKDDYEDIKRFGTDDWTGTYFGR